MEIFSTILAAIVGRARRGSDPAGCLLSQAKQEPVIM